MWFISPPVPQHKEWGVLLTLVWLWASPSQLSRWAWRTPCACGKLTGRGSWSPVLSSVEFPVHTLKFCTLLKVSAERRALHICSYWGVLELSTDGWGKFKSKVGCSKQKKSSFPSAAEEPGARSAQQWHRQALGTSRAHGCALSTAERGEQLVHSKGT